MKKTLVIQLLSLLIAALFTLSSTASTYACFVDPVSAPGSLVQDVVGTIDFSGTVFAETPGNIGQATITLTGSVAGMFDIGTTTILQTAGTPPLGISTATDDGTTVTFGVTDLPGDDIPFNYQVTFHGNVPGTITSSIDLTVAPGFLDFPGAGFDSAMTTITASLATLEVIKMVVGGPDISSDFTMTVTGPTPIPDTDGDDAGTVHDDLIPGIYVVNEIDFPGYSKAFSGDCDGSGNVTLASGESKICTVTNTFVPPANIKIIKEVINNDGGTNIEADFMIHLKKNGLDVAGSPAPGVPAPFGTDYIGLSNGIYTVSEDAGLYQQDFSDDCPDGVITLAGSDVICTITNNDFLGGGYGHTITSTPPPSPEPTNAMEVKDSTGIVGVTHALIANDVVSVTEERFIGEFAFAYKGVDLPDGTFNENPEFIQIQSGKEGTGGSSPNQQRLQSPSDQQTAPQESSGVTAFLIDIFSSLGNYLTAMIWEEPEGMKVAAVPFPPGGGPFFIPPSPGVYHFTATSNFSSGTPLEIMKPFIVTVPGEGQAPHSASGGGGTGPSKKCVYFYLDFPGAEIFLKYDPTTQTVDMICILEPIASGLITGKLLGSYLNLIRSHAIIAIVRIYLEKEGLIRLFTLPKNYQTNFIDVDDSDTFKALLQTWAEGYNFKGAVEAGNIKGFASSYDLEFILSYLWYLINKEEVADKNYRILMPTSDIRKGHLIAFIGKTQEWHKFFGLKAIKIKVDPDFDSPEFQDMITPLVALGIFTKLDHLDEAIPRQDAFPVFYRLQQLNRLLMEEFINAGFSAAGPTIFFQNKAMEKEQARKMFLQKLFTKYGDMNGLKLALDNRVDGDIQRYWSAWSKFLENKIAPFPNINRIMFSSKDPKVLVQKLSEYLNSYDKTR
jgi:hypothetical protein